MSTTHDSALASPAPVADWLDVEAMLQDPYDTYERLRQLGPVAWAPAIGRFLATSHAACRTIEEDQATYSASGPVLMPRALGSQPLLRKDDPEHAIERAPINRSMRPKNIRDTWVPGFQRNARTALERLTEIGPTHADLNRDFAGPVAALNLIDMLGF